MARRSPAGVIGSRLLQALPVILLATFMVFSLLKLVPGDIAVTLAGDNASDTRIAEIRKIYGLDCSHCAGAGARCGNPDGNRWGDQTQWLGRQTCRHGCLARRCDTGILARHDS